MSVECRCYEVLVDACTAALEWVEEASMALGKGRASWSGTGRILGRAAEHLLQGALACIQGCHERAAEPRCILGDLADALHRQLSSTGYRLERVEGKPEPGAAEEALDLLLDTLHAIVDWLCAEAKRLAAEKC